MDEDIDYKFFNLKICIENMEFDDERCDWVVVFEDEEFDYNEEVESSGSFEEDNVEFNVCLGNWKKFGDKGFWLDLKLLKICEDSRVIKLKFESEEGEINDLSDDFLVEFNVRLGELLSYLSRLKVMWYYKELL